MVLIPGADRVIIPVSASVYEQVHLNSSTDVIPSAESEAISNMPWEPQTDFHGIYSHIDTDMPNSATQETEVNTLDDPTYDVVGKENNKERSKVSHDGPPISSNSQDNRTFNNEASCLMVENEPKPIEEALEEMYAVVNKKQKKDKDDPPVPPHTVEELYTAVAKNSKKNTTGDKDKALQLRLPTEKDSKDNAENEDVA